MVIISYKNLCRPEKWIILGIPALFIMGSLMHFLYDLSGQMVIVGMFAPVNESIWEHLKMVPIPMIAWWGIYYLVNAEKYNIDANKWFFANLMSLLTALVTMVAFYYTYTQAFGIESLAMDIVDLFFCIAVGQFLGLHLYKYSKGIKYQISIILIALIVIIFIIFTFIPPQIPLFMDSQTGQYGI